MSVTNLVARFLEFTDDVQDMHLTGEQLVRLFASARGLSMLQRSALVLKLQEQGVI